MNFQPELTTGAAVIMSLTAAFLWGTWFISLKYLKNYPIDGFYMTLFATSLVFVWGVAGILEGSNLWRHILTVWAQDASRVWITLLCGMLYVFGMRLSLVVLSKIGLLLAQPIQASINILAGTAVSALVGGMPENLSVGRLAASTLFLLAAVGASMVAGNWKSRDQQVENRSTVQFTPSELWKSLGLMAVAAAFTPSYTMALSYGLKSVTQPAGLAVLPFMALLASGAFVGALLSSGIPLTVRKEWGTVLRAPLSVHKFGILSGLAHYGGNMLHTFGTAFLSAAISWPLGVTANLWTQLWGLAYGEFRGASRRVYAALAGAILFYLIGAYLVAVS